MHIFVCTNNIPFPIYQQKILTSENEAVQNPQEDRSTYLSIGLSPTMNIHLVVSIAQLKSTLKTYDLFSRLKVNSESPSVFTEGDLAVIFDTYEIERLLSKRAFRGKTQYLVNYLGYDDSHNV